MPSFPKEVGRGGLSWAEEGEDQEKSFIRRGRSRIHEHELLRRGHEQRQGANVVAPTVRPECNHLCQRLCPSNLRRDVKGKTRSLSGGRGDEKDFAAELVLSAFLFLIFLCIDRGDMRLRKVDDRRVVRGVRRGRSVFLASWGYGLSARAMS